MTSLISNNRSQVNNYYISTAMESKTTQMKIILSRIGVLWVASDFASGGSFPLSLFFATARFNNGASDFGIATRVQIFQRMSHHTKYIMGCLKSTQFRLMVRLQRLFSKGRCNFMPNNTKLQKFSLL